MINHLKASRRAAHELSLLPSDVKNKALLKMADALLKSKKVLLAANALDVGAARSKKLAAPLLARLVLTDKKIEAMAQSLRLIASLADPVGRTLSKKTRPNGLVINKVSVPIGVIFIIYESRPNVTADCMALCLKSGNSVVLKGGSEAQHSNEALFKILQKAAERSGIPAEAFLLISRGGREQVKKLLTMTGFIDLVIPRGGEGLIREVTKISRIPVIKHYKGICHVYVDKDADFQKAQKIVLNSKVQNPAVCNAMETLLVHEDIARKFLPVVCRALKLEGVELRGCERTRLYVPGVKPAGERDWTTEYLDLILSIKVVSDSKEALDHIERYGSHHSDSIVTNNKKTADLFVRAVDSACVFVNASTRFSDGGEFGMGAEMGISTDKLHARGPMGLEELTSYKYIVLGSGQIRQ